MIWMSFPNETSQVVNFHAQYPTAMGRVEGLVDPLYLLYTRWTGRHNKTGPYAVFQKEIFGW